jgi:hypothetical protein
MLFKTRSDIPIPPGRKDPTSYLGKLRTFLLQKKVGDSFPCDDPHRLIYKAAADVGVKVKRRKMEDGSGHIYWRIS